MIFSKATQSYPRDLAESNEPRENAKPMSGQRIRWFWLLLPSKDFSREALSMILGELAPHITMVGLGAG
jgi:hypothetical protein